MLCDPQVGHPPDGTEREERREAPQGVGWGFHTHKCNPVRTLPSCIAVMTDRMALFKAAKAAKAQRGSAATVSPLLLRAVDCTTDILSAKEISYAADEGAA